MSIRLISAALLTATPAASLAQWYVEPSGRSPIPRYDMRVAIDPAAGRIAVTGEVVLPAGWREGLRFSLRRDMGTPEMTIASPEQCAGPVTLEALEDDSRLLESRRWEARPTRPCPAGSIVGLHFRYRQDQLASGAGFFFIGPEGSFGSGGISAWYPRFGYTRSTGEVRYDVPTGMAVVASGRGTTHASEAGGVSFSFSATTPSMFDFAIGRFEVVRRLDGPVPITLYLRGPNPNEQRILESQARSMAILQREFGPYPFGTFAIVEVPTAPAQAARFLGVGEQGFFLSRSDVIGRAELDVAYFAHELGHQWFPYYVLHQGEDSDLMMSEALAHYGALRAVEEQLGAAAAAAFRRNAIRSALNLMAAGHDFPLGNLPDVRPALALSNTKAPIVYDMLARTIGRARFRQALTTITRRYGYGSLTWSAFLAEISRAAGTDLRWFYAQWFERPGYPVLSLDWSQQGRQLSYSIRQHAPFYRMRVPVQITFADGRAVSEEVWISGASTVFTRRRYGEAIHSVMLDPYRTAFWATPGEQQEAEARADFTRGRFLWDSNDTDGAMATFETGLGRIPPNDSHGVEFLIRSHIGWIYQEAGRGAEARRQYERALSLPVRSADYLAQVYWNLARLLEQERDCAAAITAARNVIASEAAVGQQPTNRTRQAITMLERLASPAAGPCRTRTSPQL